MSKKILNAMSNSLDKGLNVCIEGPHGVGKTQMIKQVFDAKYGSDGWAYFSGSTMDPFIDFIGCPKEMKDENGNFVLELVKPARFAYDNVKAIFIDEYNRAPKGVRNAVMELLQFKSINGKEYKNLEVVWTAINPADDEYDVEELDPAQHDRFQVHLKIGNSPVKAYFSKKYSRSVAEGAISWWKELPTEMKISPRRLDYALDGYLNKGLDIHLFLDNKTGPKNLLANIKDGPAIDRLNECSTDEEFKEFFADENNFSATKDYTHNDARIAEYVSYFPKEKIGIFFSAGSEEEIVDRVSNVMTRIIGNPKMFHVMETMKDLYSAGTNASLVAAFDSQSIMDSLDQLAETLKENAET